MGDRSLRTSFRPRPVDIGRQLNIVRDVAELDNSEEVNQAQGAAPSEQVSQGLGERSTRALTQPTGAKAGHLSMSQGPK